MKKYIKLIIVGVTLFSANGYAATGKGATEVEGLIQYTKPSGGDANGFVFGGVGRMFTDHIKVGFNGSLFISSGSNSGSIGPGVDYYFNPQSDKVAFLGASAQFGVGDNSDADFYEAHVGMKFFVDERISINTQIAFQDFEFGSATSLQIGLSYYFN